MGDDRDAAKPPDGSGSDESGSPGDRRQEPPADAELAAVVADLVRSLEALERQLRPPTPARGRPPAPRDLRRLASEVAIPALVVVLEANVRTLKLLQRALREADAGGRIDDLADDSDEGGETVAPGRGTKAGGPATDLHDRAIDASERTLDRLDDTLADLDEALAGRPTDDEADRLLAEARDLRDEVYDRLRERGRLHEYGSDRPTGVDDAVPVDVDAELASIKQELDRDSRGSDENGDDTVDGE